MMNIIVNGLSITADVIIITVFSVNIVRAWKKARGLRLLRKRILRMVDELESENESKENTK